MPELRRPPLRLLLGEIRFLVDLLKLVFAQRRLRRLPPGDGAPVVLIPGFGAGHGWMSWLRRHLSRLGYDARHWGLGRNRGDVWALVPRVARIVADLAATTGRPVRLLGWSLGGVIAREVARQDPLSVAGVLTLGSPIAGGPRYTWVARRFERRGFDLDEIEETISRLNRIPIEAPITAVYTKRDGMVAWQACLDGHNQQVRHVEVATVHLGLPLCPEVYRLSAEWLSELGDGEAS